MQLFDPILDSIAHAPEDRPASPHGSNAQQRWFRLMLDLLLDPTRWHKLGFALQWAKWLEWEGGIEKKSPTATHTPGITFLLNPLQSSRLNRLLNRLDFGLVSVETLIGCYDTGDWTVLLRADGHSTGQSPAPPQQQAQNDQEVVQTLEHLCLLALYLRHARAVLFPEQPIDAESAEEDRQIQQLVNSILSNKDAAENTSFLSKFAGQLPASWYSDEFLQTTIRMARQFMATEARDKIRVPLQVQGLASIVTLWSFWMRKTGTETTPNVLGQEMIELMAEMMAVPSLFEGTEARGLFVGCFSGLATGLDKWYAEPIQSQMTKGMVQGLERTRLVVQEASEMDAIQASLATVLKANEATSDTIRQLTTAFVRSFYGGAFHAMVSSEGGGRGRRPSLFTRDMEEESEELFQILRLFQYVVTTRAGLAVVPDKDEESEDAIKKRRRRKNKNKPRKPVQLVEQDWWTALVGGLHDAADDKSAIPLLLATAGVLLHALAFACSQTVPNLARCKVESIVDRDTLSKILTSVMFSLSEGVVPVDALLRAADAELSVSLHHPLALNNSNSAGEGSAMAWLTRITRSSSLFKEMGRLARTTAMLVESIQDVQEWHGWVRVMLQSLHAFAINIHVAWSRSGLSKLPLVAVAGVDSVRDGSKRGDQLQSQQKQEAERRRRMTELMFQAFKTILFATVMILGAITEISAQTDRLQLDAELLEAMDELVLETFGYLYFITYAMGGPGTFVVYEELITTLLTRRVTIDPALLLTRTAGLAAEDQQAPKERIYYGALNRWLQATMPRGDLSMDDPVAETRVLYFMNLVERTMMAVDEELLRSQILPLVYPYLIRRVPADAHASNIHKDLFESAHSVILSVLQTKREATGSPPSTSISRELAPYYGKLLLSHYPNEISIDQLRAGYTTLVKALSEIDDSLAWLTVERLLERIHDYDDVLLANSATVTEAMMPEKQSGQQPQQQLQLERIRERGELTLAVVDQLTSLNLIFVESLGQQIRTLLAQEPSVQNRRSLLKCVLDVVGSQAVDQTKREWAVKWYLGLVQDFGGPTEKLSEKKLPSSSLSSTAAANLIEKEATVEASQ
ncbi:hypothetical protein DFQ26_004837 [Actinomortierella ambigua]|nr:hypothetical protein DFQ26_004837 [Actinomortierella ambigua]